MTMILDSLHNLGTLFSMKHLLSISSNHLCEVGPRLFSCSASTSSMPAVFPFLRAAIPFMYSSLEKGYTNVTSPIAPVNSTMRVGLLGMVLQPLMSQCCAICLELTRHGGVGVVGSLGRLLIYAHASFHSLPSFCQQA